MRGPATHPEPAGPVAAGAMRAPFWLTPAFTPIGLAQLNARAALLQRSDNKYIVDGAVLQQAVPLFARDFHILEIDGQHSFTYETCYFDDAAYSSYFNHHQGRRRRSKVRMRRYPDAGQCFVEVKLKDKRGATVKRRLECAPEQFGSLDARALAFVQNAHQDLYGTPLAQHLRPVVTMRYQRLTLVARQGGERMTVDFDLRFASRHASAAVPPTRYLLETKSAKANGIADKLLRALHQHPTRSCSKYCISLAALQEVTRYNRFLPALRRLGLVTPDSHCRLHASCGTASASR